PPLETVAVRPAAPEVVGAVETVAVPPGGATEPCNEVKDIVWPAAATNRATEVERVGTAQTPLTSTSYTPASPSLSVGMRKVAPVAPRYRPSLRHRYFRGPSPSVFTESKTGVPSV